MLSKIENGSLSQWEENPLAGKKMSHDMRYAG